MEKKFLGLPKFNANKKKKYRAIDLIKIYIFLKKKKKEKRKKKNHNQANHSSSIPSISPMSMLYQRIRREKRKISEFPNYPTKKRAYN
jgi:hypothetical protein